MSSAPVDLNNAEAVIDLFQEAATLLRDDPNRAGARVVLPPRGRLVVTGDLHENPFHYRKIITMARLAESTDHHVILHELIHGDRLLNGMDFSYRMLGKVAQLVRAHPGQVHPMLANHELAQLTGKGVSKGAGNSVEFFREALAYVFRDDDAEVEAAINDFFRAMPLAVTSPDGVGCAHSLPDERVMASFDPGILDRPLEDADYLSPNGGAYQMTWGRRYTPTSAAQLAEAWNVKLFCLGHQHVESGIEMRGEQILVLNSDHDAARLLVVDLADLPSAELALMSATPLASLPD